VPFDIVDRRPGDVAECYADPTRARELLGWSAQFGIERMCEDAWRWQSMNPEGFRV
jgi:UDP-glucose 4-epimerase